MHGPAATRIANAGSSVRQTQYRKEHRGNMNTLRIALIAAAATLFCACSTARAQRSTPLPPASLAPTEQAFVNIAGNWTLLIDTGANVIDATLTVIQNGKNIIGQLDSSQGVVDYTGSVDGDEVKFSYNLGKFGAPGMIFYYTGSVEGDEMKGKATFATMGEGTWTAKRRK